MPTSGAGGLLIVTAIKSQLGCWEVLDVDNALGGVWHVFTRSKHGWLPWKKGWDQSIKVITCPVYIESRIPATVSFFGIIIRMYAEPSAPHHRPHFHAYYQNAVGIYSIAPIELMSGALPRRQHRLVEAWAELHQDELLANWERLQAGQPPHKVDPLQ